MNIGDNVDKIINENKRLARENSILKEELEDAEYDKNCLFKCLTGSIVVCIGVFILFLNVCWY